MAVLAAAPAAALAAPPEDAAPAAIVDGRVVDALGAPVKGAAVTLRRSAVGFERSARTDGSGTFALVALPPGPYLVTVTHDGFSAASRPLVLAAGERRSLQLALHPGSFAEEITVVATRLAGSPEALRRIPGSIEVLDRETLEASRVFTVGEALGKAAGVVVRDEEGFGLRPNIGLRGLNPTRSSKLLLLEDGIPLTFAPYGDNASYYHPPIERFESVEILKGAGQIAYGPVTMGGVINYITPSPPADPGGSLTLAGGNRGYLNGHASLGGTRGRTGARFDYLRKQGRGARDHIRSELDDVNLKVLTALGDRHTLTLKANYYGEDSNVTYSGLTEAEYEADPRQNPFHNDFFYGDRFGGSVRHAVVFGGSSVLTTHAYTSFFRRHWWRQSSNSAQRPNDSADPACGGMPNLDASCGNEGRLRRYSTVGLEPRLRVGHRLLGLRGEAELGVRAHFEDQERRQENGDSPDARSGRLVEDNQRLNQALSAFAQTRLLAGRFTITPGVRVEHVRYQRTNRLAPGATGRTALTQVVPGLGVAWSPSGASTLFAGVHRGFAPPRTEDIVSSLGGTVDLLPELSWNWELGGRGLVADGLRLEATAFRMQYENQVVPASLAGGLGATLTNGGRTLHEGLEVAARVDTGTLRGSSRNLYLRTALTWLPVARFEGRRFSSVPGFGAVEVGGRRLPYAPELALSTTVGYTNASGLEARLEAVRASRQFGDDLNSLTPSPDGQRGPIPAHTVWNAALNWRLQRLRSTVFLTVKNVLDDTYIADRSRGLLPGLPRLVQAGLHVDF